MCQRFTQNLAKEIISQLEPEYTYYFLAQDTCYENDIYSVIDFTCHKKDLLKNIIKIIKPEIFYFYNDFLSNFLDEHSFSEEFVYWVNESKYFWDDITPKIQEKIRKEFDEHLPEILEGKDLLKFFDNMKYGYGCSYLFLVEDRNGTLKKMLNNGWKGGKL